MANEEKRDRRVLRAPTRTRRPRTARMTPETPQTAMRGWRRP